MGYTGRADQERTASRSAHDLWLSYESWAIAEHGLRVSEEARSIAKLLKDSIDFRAMALSFHVDLLSDVYQRARNLHITDPQRKNSRHLLPEVALQAQYLFDDLVFNIISLFDYIGCFAGLVVEGIGSHQIDWSKSVGKLRYSPRFPVASAAFKNAHSKLIRNLLRYRSEVSHFGRDQVDGHVTIDLMGQGGDDFYVSVPQRFANAVLRIDQPGSEWNSDYPIGVIAAELLTTVHDTAVDVLDALAKESAHLPNTTPPTRVEMLVRRWSRAGVWERLSADPELTSAGVDHIGAMHAGNDLRLIIALNDGTTQESDRIDLRAFLAEAPDAEEVVNMLHDRALRVMKSR